MSQYQDTMEAMPAEINVALPGRTVYVRKRLVLLQDDDIPCVIVAPGRGGEQLDFETFVDSTYNYPVAVILVYANTGDLSLTSNTGLADRELVRDRLYTTVLAEDADVFDVTIEPNPPFEVGGEGTTVYDVFPMIVTYKKRVARRHP